MSEDRVERLVFMVSHWNDRVTVNKSQAVSCTPTYNMIRQLVSVDASGQMKGLRPSPSSEAAGQHALNVSSLSPMDLGVDLLSRLKASVLPLSFLWDSIFHFEPFFMVANLTNAYSSEQLMDRDIFWRM